MYKLITKNDNVCLFQALLTDAVAMRVILPGILADYQRKCPLCSSSQNAWRISGRGWISKLVLKLKDIKFSVFIIHHHYHFYHQNITIHNNRATVFLCVAVHKFQKLRGKMFWSNGISVGYCDSYVTLTIMWFSLNLVSWPNKLVAVVNFFFCLRSCFQMLFRIFIIVP